MTRYLVTAGVAGLVLAAAPAPKEDDAKKEVEKLQGKWQCVSVEEQGETDTGDHLKKLALTFNKDTVALKEGDQVIMKGTFTLDPSKKPKALDVTVTETENGTNKGKVLLAIYEVDKEGL